MIKRKCIFILFVLLAGSQVRVEANVDMMHLLTGGYNGKMLTEYQIDSILAATEVSASTSRYRLEWENKQQLYRHSFYADCYLVDTQKNKRTKFCDEPVRDAMLSPNGKYVVYAKKDNNLYIYKIDFDTEVPVTDSRDEVGLMDVEVASNTQIFNGISDWLYEEEFGVTSLFAFSPDSKMLAFVRLDEKEVPTFEWQTFLTDNGKNSLEVKGKGLYPKLHSLRYPKAGEKNAKATLCVYDLYYKTIREVELPIKGENYIPCLRWTVQKEMPSVVALTLNRDQTRIEVFTVNPKSLVAHPFYTEESKTCYVDYQLFNQWQWLSDGRVVVLSEKGGYAQAYMYSSQGVEQKLLTRELRDVTKIYGFNEATQTLYYQSANTPLTRQAYALNVKKNTTSPLTVGEGTHTLTFSKDLKYYVDCYQSVDMPQQYVLRRVGDNPSSGKGEVLLDNDSVAKAWQASGLPNKEFFEMTTERGDVLNGWMIKPVGFDASKRYPVVMMQYSGPASQRVTNVWRKRFGHYLASQGYLVVCVDGRGTNARGREWRNATYMALGVKEAEDQISVAKYLKTLPYVDGDRMALMGWSYGGYQTLMCLSLQSTLGLENASLQKAANGYRLETGKIWKCGVAIAPVTSWRFYDSAYTERYMRRPQVNDSGYEKADVINLADQLTGKLLLIHGLADDNVHVQQSWVYVNALVNAGKQFEMQMYPDDNHFLRNGSNYEHLHNRIMLFLENNL